MILISLKLNYPNVHIHIHMPIAILISTYNPSLIPIPKISSQS
jgi:hypothetical protein